MHSMCMCVCVYTRYIYIYIYNREIIYTLVGSYVMYLCARAYVCVRVCYHNTMYIVFPKHFGVTTLYDVSLHSV